MASKCLCRLSSLIISSIDKVLTGALGLKMYIVEDKGGAIALMLAALLFLGTWPAVLTLLERRGRLPQHIYLDYSITNLLAAVLIALTFGQIGSSKPDMPNFITQLSQVILFFSRNLWIIFLYNEDLPRLWRQVVAIVRALGFLLRSKYLVITGILWYILFSKCIIKYGLIVNLKNQFYTS